MVLDQGAVKAGQKEGVAFGDEPGEAFRAVEAVRLESAKAHGRI